MSQIVKFSIRVSLNGCFCVGLVINWFADPWGTGSTQFCILISDVSKVVRGDSLTIYRND